MSYISHNPGVPALPAWHDGRPRIGIHTSIAGDPCRALDTASRIGCTAVQIFSCSPRMWPRPHQLTIGPAVARRFRERRAVLRIGPVAIHANYLINLATPVPQQWENAIEGFRYELIRAAQLGADYVIVHPGSPMASGIDAGIARVAEAIARASVGARHGMPSRTAEADHDPLAHAQSTVRVLIENTAGQGTGLGSRFEHLRDILVACRAHGVSPEPGVCLDTAHLLAAGFEIHTAEGLERTIAEADSILGLENVRVIHTNDSKMPCASRRDRHEHIGRGHVGKEAFHRILNHPRLQHPHRAFVLETPIYRPGDDRRNVRTVWSLLGAAPTAPRRESRDRRALGAQLAAPSSVTPRRKSRRNRPASATHRIRSRSSR